VTTDQQQMTTPTKAYMEAAALVANAFAAGLRPEPELSVSEWADTYRIVGKPSPEPGPWRTSRVPYMREIMDDLSPSSPVEIVVLMKAAQGAGTEAAMNALGCWMHQYPDSTLVVQPTVDAAKKFSRIRLDRMIESCPVLRNIVAAPRERDKSNTISLKEFGPGRDTLVLTGANSGVGLRSYPSRFAIGDEIDGYPVDVDGEGSPIDLMLQRTGAFRNRKVFLLSTPTIAGFSNVHTWFLAGDQRRYEIPCPACSARQPLVWYRGDGQIGGLKWPAGSPDLARYECAICGERWEEWRKTDMLPLGAWTPQAPGTGRGKIHSYHVNALYYPYGWPENAWPNLAERWERDHRDPVRLKTFVNLKLGEPWRDPTEAKADADTLMARRESYGPEIPAGAAILTVGADVQANRIEAEVVAWGRDEESWSINYRVLLGDTTKPEVWIEFDALLRSEFLSELGVPLSIKAACVDAGYNSAIVKKFCGDRASRRIWPIVGRDGQGRPIWPTKTPRARQGRPSPAHVVGVDQVKEVIYNRLKITEPGPGFSHFPVTRDRDYFEMLTAEVRVPDYTGTTPKFTWKKKTASSRNEALDARGYAYACLVALQMTTALRLNSEVSRLEHLAESHAGRAPVVSHVTAADGDSPRRSPGIRIARPAWN
jgi:phage terminase large subunit GpA-like protein